MYSRWLLILILLLSAPGCIHRRLTITSDPPNALAKVDGKVIGYTPVSLSYTWYGERKVQLLKDGYETRTQMVKLGAPWYQVFPFEFFSDNFLLHHKEDRRQVHIRMQPRQRDSAQNLLNRARSLRSSATNGL